VLTQGRYFLLQFKEEEEQLQEKIKIHELYNIYVPTRERNIILCHIV
jgi:hypothetical protein